MRTRPFTISDALPALAAVSAVCAFLGTLGGAALLPAALGAWLWLMLSPGLVLALLCRENDVFRALLAAVVLSPLVFAAFASLAMLAGATPQTAAAITAGVTLAGALAAWRIGRPARPATTHTRWLVLSLLTVATVLAVCYLPMTREWWRMRSDAWFHAAVVAQIRDYGLPPEDPYFAGMPLQYMWLYHVMVLVLAQTTTLDPFRVMALINVQALAGLCLAGWAMAGVFRSTTLHRVCATLSLLFAFNAAFWIFLPVKAARALIGDVKGTAELARTFSLHPFNYETVCGLSNIYYNQEFFLDKFMVATAFGFALTYLTAAWYGALDYLATRRGSSLAILAASMLGMLGFHSLVGFVMVAGMCGSAFLLLVMRSRVERLQVKDLAVIVAVPLLCLLAASPYLYELMRMKESDQIFPVSVSLQKTIGIGISCALAAFLLLRYRVLFSDRSPPARFLLFGALATTIFCLAIRLPGPNTFDKLGYFVFIPISIPAGFAVADTIAARRGRARALVAGAWIVLFLLPLNGLALAACYHTPGEAMVTGPELRLSEWVQVHTPRDALFIDHDDHVFLLVTGPRRYYWGRWAYASQWGYPRARMALRWHAMRSLYRATPPDAAALRALGAVTEPLFAVARPEDRDAHAALLAHPELFRPVYDGDGLTLYRIDTGACRDAAASAPPAPSSEEMLRASGL